MPSLIVTRFYNTFAALGVLAVYLWLKEAFIPGGLLFVTHCVLINFTLMCDQANQENKDA